jgi:replicative DNA helicase
MSEEENTRFRFGILSLDRYLGDISWPQFVVLAGQPGDGKSMLAMQGALNAASRGIRTALFQYQISDDALQDRIFAHRTGLSREAMRAADITERERELLWNEGKQIIEMPLHIGDPRENDIAGIERRLNQLKLDHADLRVAIVDPFKRVKGHEASVWDACDRLKFLSRSLEVVLVVPTEWGCWDEEEEDAIKRRCDVFVRIVRDPEGDGDNLFVVAESYAGKSFAVPVRLDGEAMTMRERELPQAWLSRIGS